MRSRWRRSTVVAAVMTLVALDPHVAAASPQELVWVTSTDGRPVAAYPVNGSGAVAAQRTVGDPHLANTFWGPWGVAFDPAGRMYVQSFLSNATTFVFAPGARRQARPVAVFAADGPDTRAIAVDSHGYEYIASSEGPSYISVVAPGADGKASSSYRVSPVRSFSTDEQGFNPWPGILAVDDEDHLIAALTTAPGNSIETFSGGPTGPPAPIRRISGSRTGLGTCTSSPCDEVSVAASSITDDTVAGVSAGAQTHISLWRSTASGNAEPLRTISGPSTGLDGETITGLSVSATTGDIFAMVKSAQFGGPGRIEVFAPGASGDATPITTFTDATHSFDQAAGIAVH